MSRSRTITAAAAGFLGGMLVGAAVWSTQIARSRRELFSPNPWRRLAALGYLGGQPGLETVRLLTDYVRWERHPGLRRRAERLLHRMEVHLA